MTTTTNAAAESAAMTVFSPGFGQTSAQAFAAAQWATAQTGTAVQAARTVHDWVMADSASWRAEM